VSLRVPSGSRSWRSSPSTSLRVPPMEVEWFKHRQLAPTVGPSSRSSANSKDLSSKSNLRNEKKSVSPGFRTAEQTNLCRKNLDGLCVHEFGIGTKQSSDVPQAWFSKKKFGVRVLRCHTSIKISGPSSSRAAATIKEKHFDVGLKKEKACST
jgi:hypothetical protein